MRQYVYLSALLSLGLAACGAEPSSYTTTAKVQEVLDDLKTGTGWKLEIDAKTVRSKNVGFVYLVRDGRAVGIDTNDFVHLDFYSNELPMPYDLTTIAADGTCKEGQDLCSHFTVEQRQQIYREIRTAVLTQVGKS